jgi:hypothetical protein
MYRLIVDGLETSAKGTFDNLKDALWWYNYVKSNGANSAALWCNQILIQFFTRGE